MKCPDCQRHRLLLTHISANKQVYVCEFCDAEVVQAQPYPADVANWQQMLSSAILSDFRQG